MVGFATIVGKRLDSGLPEGSSSPVEVAALNAGVDRIAADRSQVLIGHRVIHQLLDI